MYFGIKLKDECLGNDESYNFSVVGVGAGGGGREVVTDLRAWVQYAVAVRAYNAHGAGPVSPPVVVRTLEDVPSSPPVGVECSGGAGGTSLYVRWAPPPPAFHNGLLQGYRLTLTRLDDSTEKVEELIRMTSGREESVGGLRAWSNYTVTVAAVTRAGAGVSSPDLICTTREDARNTRNKRRGRGFAFLVGSGWQIRRTPPMFGATALKGATTDEHVKK
ncbi:Down syndrome cell adhesion molecule-like protein Dscam2 [Penaeus monodon]|uniref:Down syndrome cell adhesion molecule-like protein Dscam2 n=1 Tax=Penaeus monodon TaxID=6687 RepID=UPI0018A79558|nr:Down syndrome cell adhesion molecule-like protein Dscam2 [Penaeus monodon]